MARRISSTTALTRTESWTGSSAPRSRGNGPHVGSDNRPLWLSEQRKRDRTDAGSDGHRDEESMHCPGHWRLLSALEASGFFDNRVHSKRIAQRPNEIPKHEESVAMENRQSEDVGGASGKNFEAETN